MRMVFAQTLTELARQDKDICIVTPDMGYSILDCFEKEFPDRFFNVGIAEQNAVSVAAGLALSGKKPYVYSIIPFVTMRCFEQIRVDVAYMNTNVKLVGVGAGFEYGSAGYTHQGVEDLSVMRCLPNMIVCGAGDNREMEEIVKQSAQIKTPMYMRIGRHNRGILNRCDTITVGKASVLEKGEDIALIAVSNMLPSAVDYAETLKKNGRKPYIISMHTVKPIDKDLMLDLINKGVEINTFEEHTIVGGLGSAVAEIIAESGKGVKFKRFGIPDVFSHYVGNQYYIKDKFGLNFDKQENG